MMHIYQSVLLSTLTRVHYYKIYNTPYIIIKYIILNVKSLIVSAF